MILIGRLRFLDVAKVERGLVEVWRDGEVITLTMQRDGAPGALHVSPSAAEKIARYLDSAADAARGA